ncbi:MAG: ribokinase [Rhizobiaceae bacterium]|nr:ribokinase [Rhizobiaceae bacterium]
MISVLGVFNADLKFLVERFPKTGETLHAISFEVQPGGKGFNQAVASRRAMGDGGTVVMLTQLGEDNFAQMARGVMEREKIDASHVLTSAAMPTGTAMIMVEEKSADNKIVIAPGAASLLGEKEVNGFGDVITSSTLFMTNLEVPMVAAKAGLVHARANSVKTLFDPAPACQLAPELYQQLDFITPNESEAGLLVGFDVRALDDAVKAGKILCSRGVGTAIVTMGSLGVVAVSGKETITMPAFEIENTVDTTGAGDAFNGCFAARFSEGAKLEDALRFASAGAALCVGKFGAADAMPLKKEIEEFMSK